MANNHVIGDISVFSAGGVSLLGIVEDVAFDITEDQKDVSLTNRFRSSAQGLKLDATIKATIMSTLSAPDRVSHLNLTALSLGDSLLGVVTRLKFSSNMEKLTKAGVGSWWKEHQIVGGDFMAEVEIEGTTDTFAPYIADAVSLTGADRNATLDFTLNAIAYTLPMRMETIGFGTNRRGFQVLKIALKGRDPDTGTYPTAPVGTTSIVEKAINDPATVLAYSFTSKAADGFTLAGNMVWDSMEFEVVDGEIVNIQYNWSNTGTPTAGAT